MMLFPFLAGMSFVLAAVSLTVAIAEHYRAERAEAALRVTLAKDNAFHCRENLERAGDIAKLSRNNVEIWTAIQGVAAASLPPTFPADQSKVYISVPGPRTPQ